MLKKKKPIIILSTISALLIFGLLVLYYIYNPENSNLFPKCIFYKITNLHCPGCGSQRAIHNILQGNILKGLSYNILIALLLLVLGYKFVLFGLKHILNKEFKNLFHNAIVTKCILVFILLFWILRNIAHYPFTFLAP
jgi:hypothetical protein